jgi:hypothetical protein
MKRVWKFLDQYEPILMVTYVAANIFGAGFYCLVVNSIANQAQQERRAYYEAGDSFTFICTGLPVLAVCLLINLIWGIKVVRDVLWRRRFLPFVVGVMMAILWILVYCSCRAIANAAIQNGIIH